jgi:pilus assembly protein FimV
MVAKRSSRAAALLLMLPSAAFALGFGDIRLLSPLNAPLDAQIELTDATPEEMQTLQAQIGSRDTYARNGLDWPIILSTVQVKTTRTSDGHALITLKSTDPVTEPFLTLLIEVNWARGRSVREYTILLDPPVYTPGQSAASNAPVAAPSSGAGTREGAIARGAEAAPPALPAPGGDVAAPAATASSTDSSAASDTSNPATSRHKGHARTAKASLPPAPSDAGAGASGNSHVVQRGETLSSIAAGAAAASENSPETHSWMLAIFQANPRAFEQNMNVLRTGAVLRMPESSEVSAVSPAAAATEIRRQYAAWRGGAAPEGGAPTARQSGQLHLVTPSDDSGPATGPSSSSGEVKALQNRVHDLEGQLSEQKRLLAISNAELNDLQAKSAVRQGAPAAPPAPPPAQAQAAPPPPVEEPPAAKAEPPASASPPPAEEPAAQTAEAPPPPPVAAPKPAETAHRPTPAANQGGSFVDSLMDYWWALALLVVAVAGYFGFKTWRSRRQSEFDDSLSRLAVAGASSAERGFAAGDTAPMRPIGGEDPEGAFLVEESGTHQRPRFGAAAAAPAAARHVSTSDETISSEAAINLDQGDPLAEADFHMAYGLYDQAADLIRIAINREPNRRDLKLKLLEVFFVWGNKEQFLQAAHELAATRAEAAPGEWEKIVIMGKQLAPDDSLFAGGGTMGATAGGVDLDLEGGQSRVDFDLLGEPVPGAHGSDVDLDIGSALGEEEGNRESGTATDRNAALDSGFQTSTSNSTGTTRQMTARIPQSADDDLMSEFGGETEGPTVEQPALSSADNPTIRQKVAMALKQTPPAEQTAELAIDDLGLDLAGLDTMDQPGLGASSDAPTLVAGMDDRSRKIMEEAQRRAVSEDTSLSTGAWQLDENELDAALAEGHPEEVDGSVTSRLSQLTGRDVDYDLGESQGEHATNGSGLDLDLGTQTVPDAAFTATQKLNSDDLALPDLEPVTMSEVGTKLDLARAYMDMGDPDGAKNILEEVLHEGSMTQKQEAQRLMESLPG